MINPMELSKAIDNVKNEKLQNIIEELNEFGKIHCTEFDEKENDEYEAWNEVEKIIIKVTKLDKFCK
ncbi:MAG: hypothetical protein WC755_07435 [Candidatus Woesearchaeota archaeon]|jgi:hypothetical protein